MLPVINLTGVAIASNMITDYVFNVKNPYNPKYVVMCTHCNHILIVNQLVFTPKCLFVFVESKTVLPVFYLFTKKNQYKSYRKLNTTEMKNQLYMQH